MNIKPLLFAALFSLPQILPAQSGAPEDSIYAVSFTKRTFTSPEIQRLPLRGISNYLALLPGVVQQNGHLHLRGSRAGETAYFIDGIPVTNRFFNREGITLIPEAIERIEISTGAYDAAFGGANGGLVQTRMRTGGARLEAALRFETDDFAKTGKEFFNTTAFGYRNLVATMGGPLPRGANFFLAGEHRYWRNRQPIFLAPFRFDHLLNDSDFFIPHRPLPGPIILQRNYLPNNWHLQNTLQGNFLLPLHPQLALRGIGSYAKQSAPEGGNWPYALENYFRQSRNMRNENAAALGALRFEHTPNPKISYNLALSWQHHSSRLYDPDFGDNWLLYTDSLANAQKGYTDFRRRYAGPLDYSTVFFFKIKHPHAPNTTYQKNQQTARRAALDLVIRPASKWEIQIGASAEAWTLRKFAITYIPPILELLNGFDGKQPRKFTSANQRRVAMAGAGGIDFYGYDVDGRQTDSGLDAPRRPRFFSAYWQNTLRDERVTLSFGGRFERFDLRMPRPRDDYNLPFDFQLDWLDESKLVQQQARNVFLPRLNTAWPLNPNTNLYLAYGQYAGLPALNDLFLSPLGLVRALMAPADGWYWFLDGTAPGYTLKPERSTHYEAGLTQRLNAKARFSVNVFYKNLRDQARLDFLDTTHVQTRSVVVFKNNGAGTAKGLELTLRAQAARRFTGQLYYTFSQAQGNGSHLLSNGAALATYPYERKSFYPEFNSPLDYDQTHRGALLLDWRFAESDVGRLKGFGLTALLTFNNGHPYTTQQAGPLGGSSPWNWAVRTFSDPRTEEAAEPPNRSRTPAVFNVDLQISQKFALGKFRAGFFGNVLNLFNRRHVINVYPLTGNARGDGWFASDISSAYETIPNFVAFYNAINRDNRWAYMQATGNDLFGAPRQLRVGIKLER